MEKNSLIFVAGHRGLVGSAIVRELKRNGYQNLLLRTSSELDLRDQSAVRDFFEKEKPDYVVLAAARVGGIGANSRFRAQMLYDNLMIQSNVIDSAYRSGVTKLLFLGSSCIYPRLAPQPMKEEHLLTSELEYTNEPYAIAKIAGLKMCEAYNLNYGTDFISVMPTNLYGENDNFDLENGHVLPVLIRKFHEAKKAGAPTVELWGTGEPKREFLHVDDLARASVMLLEKISFKEIQKLLDTFWEVNHHHHYNVAFKPSKVEGKCDICGSDIVQRDDETEEVVKQRLKTYDEKTAPLIGFYEKLGLVFTPDATESEDIMAILEEKL